MDEPKRILALHANYAERGGEDISHETEVSYLTDRGHDVYDLRASNAELGTKSLTRQASSTLFNRSAQIRIRSAIREARPDVAYVNNLFPALSFAALAELEAQCIPVVRVLRNYRSECIAGTLYRDGKFCQECTTTTPLAGVAHACFRGSRAASVVAAVNLRIGRRYLHRSNLEYIAVSNFVRERAVLAGVSSEYVTVRPNLFLGDTIADDPTRSRGQTILFVGRDRPEKGLALLLNAFDSLRSEMPRLKLRVAGVETLPFTPEGTTLLGDLPHHKVVSEMQKSALLVVPSLWPEPFGRVVVESLAAGTPVLVSQVGGLAELAGPAVDTFKPTTAESLAGKIASIFRTGNTATAEVARDRYLTDFSADIWYSKTLSSFEKVIRRCKI